MEWGRERREKLGLQETLGSGLRSVRPQCVCGVCARVWRVAYVRVGIAGTVCVLCVSHMQVLHVCVGLFVRIGCGCMLGVWRGYFWVLCACWVCVGLFWMVCV